MEAATINYEALVVQLNDAQQARDHSNIKTLMESIDSAYSELKKGQDALTKALKAKTKEIEGALETDRELP